MFKFGKPAEKPFRRCVLLCALLFAICAALPPLGAGAAELTNDSIRQKEASIEQSKKEREQIESNISDLKSIKKDLESSKQNLQQYVTNLDAQVTTMQGKIDDLNQKISTKKTEISEKEKELEEAEKQRDDQYDVMKKRIKFIYERGNGYYLEILIKSGSFSDMLNRATYVSMLSDYDQKQLEELAKKAKEVSLAKQDLEEEKKTLDAAEQSVRTEQNSMQSLIADKKTQIEGISSEITTKEESIRQYEAEKAEQDSTIAALEKAVADEKAKLAEQNARHFAGGVFTWPCPNYSYISSEFGYRIHPIYGYQRFHSGLDMAAPSGSPILAAADGKVVAASYEATMGNYVMIDHGDGLYTVYMHASALYVSAGQEVSAGTQIAAVGSTGSSTGPHLHFSVRLNGQYVNPHNYLGG